MRKEQEIIEINKLYEKFKNAQTDREKLEIYVAFHNFSGRFYNVVREENYEIVDKMRTEYFFPTDENGKVDEEKQNERFTAYNEWVADNLAKLGNKINEYKEEIDAKYEPSTDEKGRDEHLEMAKKYGVYSVEGKITGYDGDIKNALVSSDYGWNNKERDADQRRFLTKLKSNYEAVFNNLSPEKKALCDLAKEEAHDTPFVTKYYDNKTEYIEDARSLKEVMDDPILSDLIGGRKFDVYNMNQISAWHSTRNNKKLERIMDSIKGNERESKTNSDLYQKIIDTYERACDAPSASKYTYEMKQLSMACKDYIDHRNPFYDDGKARLDLVKSLDEHIDKVLMPTINKKVDTFELVDKDTLLKEMEEDSKNEIAKNEKADDEIDRNLNVHINEEDNERQELEYTAAVKKSYSKEELKKFAEMIYNYGAIVIDDTDTRMTEEQKDMYGDMFTYLMAGINEKGDFDSSVTYNFLDALSDYQVEQYTLLGKEIEKSKNNLKIDPKLSAEEQAKQEKMRDTFAKSIASYNTIHGYRLNNLSILFHNADSSAVARDLEEKLGVDANDSLSGVFTSMVTKKSREKMETLSEEEKRYFEMGRKYGVGNEAPGAKVYDDYPQEWKTYAEGRIAERDASVNEVIQKYGIENSLYKKYADTKQKTINFVNKFDDTLTDVRELAHITSFGHISSAKFDEIIYACRAIKNMEINDEDKKICN